MNDKQRLFREMVFGTLVYAVVLGFFNDYTDILHTDSYSTTFLVAIVMQLLTYLTFLLKDVVSKKFKANKIALVLGVWLLLFLSKFVFLAVINLLFGYAVEISGFVGLMIVIVTMTVIKQSLDAVFKKLA